MFYLITIQYLNDGTKPSSMAAYTDEKAVISAYYSTLASCYINDNLDFFSVTIMDEAGNILMHDHRYKEVLPDFIGNPVPQE